MASVLRCPFSSASHLSRYVSPQLPAVSHQRPQCAATGPASPPHTCTLISDGTGPYVMHTESEAHTVQTSSSCSSTSSYNRISVPSHSAYVLVCSAFYSQTLSLSLNCVRWHRSHKAPTCLSKLFADAREAPRSPHRPPAERNVHFILTTYHLQAVHELLFSTFAACMQ